MSAPRLITSHDYNGYTYGCRCDVCKAAKAERMREYRHAARDARLAATGAHVVPDIKHGYNGYQNHQCRCEVCSETHRTLAWARRRGLPIIYGPTP